MHNMAILVGCTTYNNLASLPLVENDIEIMTDVLIKHCGCKRKSIKSKILKDNDKGPRDKFIDMVKKAENVLGKDEFDILFFYFSGHGEADNESIVKFLLPNFERGTDESYNNSSLSLKQVIDDLIKRFKAKNIVAIIDTCRTISKGENLLNYISLDESYESSGVVLLFSCSEDEESKTSQSLGGSVYTYYLAEALRENPSAKVEDIRSVVKEKMKERSQTPEIKVKKRELQELIITEPGEDVTEIISGIEKVHSYSLEYRKQIKENRLIRNDFNPTKIIQEHKRIGRIRLIYYGRTYLDEVFSKIRDIGYTGILEVIIYDVENDSIGVAREQDRAQQKQVINNIKGCQETCTVTLTATRILPTFRGMTLYDLNDDPICGCTEMYHFFTEKDAGLVIKRTTQKPLVYYCDRESCLKPEIESLFSFFECEFERMSDEGRPLI